MCVQRTSYSAAVGKGEELRQLLNEAVIAYQAEGIRLGLSRPVFGAAGEFNTLVVTETLAELQATRERILAGAGYRTRVAQTVPLLATQPVSLLIELIVPFPAGSAPKYTQGVLLTPAAGKLVELRRITEDRVRARQSELRIALGQTVFGADQALIVNVGLADFAAVDALRERNRTDPDFLAYQEQILPLLARTPEVALYEVLVPLQPIAARELAGAATR